MQNSEHIRHKNFIEIAIRQINAACPEKINADLLIRCLRTGKCEEKWKPHIWAFLEELPIPLIHDIVLSGALTFEELAEAIEIWECSDVPTTEWIREMAALRMETTA